MDRLRFKTQSPLTDRESHSPLTRHSSLPVHLAAVDDKLVAVARRICARVRLGLELASANPALAHWPIPRMAQQICASAFSEVQATVTTVAPAFGELTLRNQIVDDLSAM